MKSILGFNAAVAGQGPRGEVTGAQRSEGTGVFAYRDPSGKTDGNGVLDQLKEHAARQSPDMDLVDGKGLRHRLWRITDAKIQANISTALQDQCIYIADGHHRYETALNYRDWVKENTPDFDGDHPANVYSFTLPQKIA